MQTQDERRYKELGEMYIGANIHAEYCDFNSSSLANACSSCALTKRVELAFPSFFNSLWGIPQYER